MGNTLKFFSAKQSPPFPSNNQHNNIFPSVNMRESQLMNQSFDINLLKKRKPTRYQQQIINDKQGIEESQIIENLSLSTQRIVPLRMPETYNMIAEFNNIAKQQLIFKKQAIEINKQELINNSYTLTLWNQPTQLSESSVKIVIDHQFQFNPANDKFNTLIISIIKHMSTFNSTIIQSNRFNVIQSQQNEKRKRYSTKLFLNGEYRTVECVSRQSNWIKLLESAVHSIFLRRTNFAEYCYYILRWIPIACDLVNVSKDDVDLFDKVKKEYQKGNVIGAVESKGGLCFSLLDFVFNEDKKSKYVVGKLGGYKEEVKQFISNIPQELQYRISKQKNIYVFDWDLLIKNKSVLYLASNPYLCPHQLTLHNSWTQPLLKTLFVNQTISLYYNPQYVLRIYPHQQQIKLKIVLQIHNNNFTQITQNYPHVSMFVYDGNRVVYLKDQISPNHQCTINDIYTGIYIFSQSQISEYYSLVIFNSDKKSYRFTLQLYSESQIQAYPIPSPQKRVNYEIQGTFDQDNIGQNIFSPQFLNNPIYHFNVNSPTQLQIFLQAKEKSFKLTNLIVQITQNVTLESIRSFLSQYYQDFIKLYLSSGFYYPSIAYNRIKVTEPSKYLYIPLGYQSETPSDYTIRIVTDNKNIEVKSAKWKAFEYTVSQTGLYQPDFTHKHPHWQEVFELTSDIIKSNRVYYFNFTQSISCIFKITSLTYQRTYVFQTQERIGDAFYAQPDLALYICKVKKSDDRLLAKICQKTEFSKCPSGLRTKIIEIEEEKDILFWAVVVMVEYFENEPEIEYQLSLNSNKKIEFGRFTIEKKKSYFK